MVFDWQRQCQYLSEPITTDNFPEWWKVVKMAVLQYWRNPEGNYQEALKKIGDAQEEEWRRRDRALTRIRQAFRNLLNLPK
jgi:hypothetical protein